MVSILLNPVCQECNLVYLPTVVVGTPLKTFLYSHGTDTRVFIATVYIINDSCHDDVVFHSAFL